MRHDGVDDRTRAFRFLVVAATALCAVWMLSPAAPLPIYDGLPVPADRYRYLDPPVGVRNPGPPLAAHVTIQLIGGGNSAIDLPTAERPPQAEVSLHHGDVEGNRPDVPAVTTAEVRITAVPAPTAPLPPGRQVHGNVYDISVVAAGVSLAMRPGSTATVSLRQPKSSDADPRIAVLEHGHWQLLATHKGVGAGVLTAGLPALGLVTILERTGGFVAPSSHFRWDLLALGVLLALGLLAVAAVRRRRRTG